MGSEVGWHGGDIVWSQYIPNIILSYVYNEYTGSSKMRIVIQKLINGKTMVGAILKW